MKTFILVITFLLMGVPSFAGGKHFSDKSVKGCYGFEFHGTLIQELMPFPVAATGRLCGDGKGRVTELSRVLHTPDGIIHQTATGTYQVMPDGIGQASFDVMTSGVPTSKEQFHFVVTNSTRTLQFVSGEFLGPTGEDVGLIAIVSGAGIRQ